MITIVINAKDRISKPKKNRQSCLDMFLQELSVVVEKRRYGVLGQNVIADLLLHETKMLGDVFLQHKSTRQCRHSFTKPSIFASLNKFPT